MVQVLELWCQRVERVAGSGNLQDGLEDGKSELAVDWENVEDGGEDGGGKVVATGA